MEMAFYVSAIVALVSTMRVITTRKPVHGLLYLVVSLLAVAMIFFAVGAPFAGVLEIIVYAGAIMVLFVFAVMMLNLDEKGLKEEQGWTALAVWIGPSVLTAILLSQLVYSMAAGNLPAAGLHGVDARQVGIALYGPYLLCVELASVLLLAALVAAYHLGRADEKE
ncbi:MAG TPA: NADH-quinone oxidoreductase subunit J [Pseudomonadales bacterium]|nr:NADH-quinone oxidoreductase subunit J [Pseudomonadales bacterium]